MTDAGTQTYSYDSVNRLTQVTRGTDTFAYAYDLVGDITRRTYPDSTVVDYAYDDDSRLATVVTGGQTTTYAYDAAAHLTQTTLPSGNGYVEERTYDRAGRLTRVKSAKGTSVLADFSSTLDPVGNPTQVVRDGNAPGTTTYAYDIRDRLTEVCFQVSCPGGSDPFIRWTYDAVGNRLTEARPSGTTTYSYNAADELAAASSTSYTYDENGNETAAGSRTFIYDLANRLSSTSSGGTTTTYTYDGEGNRLQASTGSQPSAKTNFLWDVNDSLSQLALERDGDGSPIRRYVYGRAIRVSMTSGGSAHYYHYDRLGSVANVTSSTGTTEWTYAYEPFGAAQTEAQDDPSAPTNVMKFASELADATGLYYLRARQYDSLTARFLRADPASADQKEPYTSAYAYVADRPTVFIDPSGKTLQPTDAAQAWASLDLSGCNGSKGGGDALRALQASEFPIGPLNSCRTATFRGNAGVIHVQTDKKTNRLSFSVTMFNPMWNFGALFTWSAYLGYDKIGGRLQGYPPHSSWPQRVLRTGAVFSLRVHGEKFDGRVLHETDSVPVKCIYWPW